MTRYEFIVDGMTCGGCVRSVENALKRLDPQAAVAVDLGSRKVEVTTSATREDIVTGIEDAGFDVIQGQGG